MRAAVLVSPGAGGGRGGLLGALLVTSLTEGGHEVVEVTGDTAAASQALAAEAVRSGADALVVVGGDGAVQLGAAATALTGVPLVVVPAGSGNDAARALGVPPLDDARSVRRVHAALDRWSATGDAQRVDLMRVRVAPGTEGAGADEPAPRWVVGVLAAGFDAAVNARANRWAADWRDRSAGHRVLSRVSLPGRARYTAAVLRELPAWRPRPYRVVLDGRVVEGPAVLVAVAGTTSYGGGLRIAPGAVTDDGLADVVIVGGIGRGGLLAMLPTVFGGWHVRHPAVTVHRAAVVDVALAPAPGRGADPGGPTDPGPVVHGDGEPLGLLPARVEVVPGALLLLR